MVEDVVEGKRGGVGGVATAVGAEVVLAVVEAQQGEDRETKKPEAMPKAQANAAATFEECCSFMMPT